MKIIKSKQLSQGSVDSAGKEAVFEFGSSGEVVYLKCHLLKDEKALKEYAIRVYKKEYMSVTELSIKVPLTLVSVGDIISIYAADFNIPDNVTSETFKVSSVTHSIENLKAITDIVCKRWNNGT